MAASDKIKEKSHDFIALKSFQGLNTQPSRTALDKEEFAWIENAMPIGDAFIPVIPGPSAAIATVPVTISSAHFANISSTNYIITFNSSGGAHAVNLATNATVTVAPGGTFTSPQMDQWKSERAVIIDPSTGFFSWDGNLFQTPGSLATVSVVVSGSGYTSAPSVGFTGGGGSNATATATITGGGVSAVTITAAGSGYTSSPAVTFTGGGGSGTTATAFIMPVGLVGNAIAVYSGRVWIASNRVITFTAPGSWVDVATANAAGSTVITEGFLREKVYALEALDNYLYVFGDSSIFIIGDLKVTSGITTFSLTNISSTIGTTFPFTITAMERAIVFLNKYGVYVLFGASVQKISKPLDGIFPDIALGTHPHPISSGLVQIFNILCYAINFHYTGTRNGITNDRHMQAVYFDGKWFMTSQGDEVTFIVPTEINGTLGLYGTTGQDLFQLYNDSTVAIDSKLITALLPFESPILDKQMNRAGIEYTSPALATVNLQIDTENASQASPSASSSQMMWFNNSGGSITWTNNLSQVITWLASGFLLFSDYSDVVGKYLGFTVTSSSPQVIYHGLLGEYTTRASW